MHYIYDWNTSGDNLYPAHVFDWSYKVINCPTEDYSVGGVSDQIFTFVSDIKMSTNSYFLQIDGELYYIQDMEHVNNGDRWKYICLPGYPIGHPNGSSWDEIIPDATLEQWAQQTMTLNDLYRAICTWTLNTDGLAVNGSYVINSNFGYTGITKRQVMQWIAQLTGGNVAYKICREVIDNTQQTITRGGTGELILNPRNVKNIVLSDFTVPQIDKIWFGTDSSDVGVSYGTGKQQLSLPYNPLINPNDDSFLQPLYNSIRSRIPVYTPMKVELFNEEYTYELNGSTDTIDFSSSGNLFRYFCGSDTQYGSFPGLRLRYTDENNNTYIAPIFSYEYSPRGVTIECTGNPSRETSNALISSEIAQNGKYNKFKRTLDETVSEIASLNGDVSTLQQTAASLTVQVASKVGEDEIISKINQTAETITINASKINLVGAVTFSDLDSSTQSAINDKTDASEVTQIIGNTVNAAYINALEINAKKIVATYTKTFNHSNYSSNDKIVVNQLRYSKNWTQSDLDRYDINMDGQITDVDVNAVRDMVDNGVDKTATIKTEIDPSKVGNPIAIYANGATTPGASMNGSSVKGNAGFFNNITTSSVINSPEIRITNTSAKKQVLINGNQVEFRDVSNGTSLIGTAAVIIDSGTTSTTTNYTMGGQSYSVWIDWDYKKWGDGTYECWGAGTFSIPNGSWNSGWSPVYTSSLLPHVNYPTTFTAAPHEHAQVCPSNDLWGAWLIAGSNANSNNTTTKSGQYQIARGDTASTYSATQYRIEFHVFGKVAV